MSIDIATLFPAFNLPCPMSAVHGHAAIHLPVFLVVTRMGKETIAYRPAADVHDNITPKDAEFVHTHLIGTVS